MSDSPFDPPKPKPPTAKETAVTVIGGLGVIAADIATGGLLSTLAAIPSGGEREGPPDIRAGLAAIADTAAPARDGDRAACTRCAAWVPYASMALNEDGYFCARCAAELSQG
ncbi:MAG: hypothetical protein K8W52_41000 [Deltaproteobacteria bacterium]|nr:hypothetical protein [Deltaproteobacteria bacterium]